MKRKHAGKGRRIGDEIIESLAEFKQALISGEPLASKFNCRQVVLELGPHEFAPEDVRSTRRLLGTSQGVFAKFLGVSLQTVRAWEQGSKAPREVARRFMDEIRRDPAYWRARLQSAVRPKNPARTG